MNHLLESNIVHRDDLVVDPAGSRIFAVGAIQGRLHYLKEMIAKIEAYPLAKNDKVVFLGNYISEEDNAKQIVDALQEYETCRPDQVILLKGSLEQTLMLSRKSLYERPIGQAVLKSYRINGTLMRWGMINFKEFLQHREWIAQLPCFYRSERFFFVHSGLNPAKSLDKQHLGGLMFIQDPFYTSDVVYPQVVVHTHPNTGLMEKPGRIGIGQEDEVLSCVVFKDQGVNSKDTVYEEILTVGEDV